MQASLSSGSFLRAGLVAVVVTVVWASAVDVTSMPPLFPLGPQPVYSASDASALVTLEPVLHAPWLGRPAPAVAWLAGFLVILGGSGVAHFSGATPLAAALVLAALALDASFGTSLAHAAPMALAVGFVWLSAGAAFDERTRRLSRPWFNPLSALLLWAIAVWIHWLAVVAWPIVWAALGRTPGRPGRGVWTIGSVVAGAVALVGHFHWVAAVGRRVSANADAALGWQDAMRVAFDTRTQLPPDSFAAPELSTRIGMLLLALTLVALTSARLGRWWRRTALACTLLAIVVAVAWPVFQTDVTRFAQWALAPLAAVGLSWVARAGGRPLLLTAALGGVAIAEAVVSGARPLGGVEGRGVRDALEQALGAQAARAPLVLMAEDTRVDSAVLPWIAARAPHVLRAAHDPEAVARARAEGRTVLAGPTGSRLLEVAGVSFVEAFRLADPVPFEMSAAAATYRCVPVLSDRWSQLPGLEYTGRLGVWIPPGVGGALVLVVGDPVPLALGVETADGRALALDARPLSSSPGAAPPPADYWIDTSADDAASHTIRRITLAADPLRSQLLSVRLGRRAPRVIARLTGLEDGAHARVCAAPLGSPSVPDGSVTAVSLDHEAAFATGWYGREGKGAEAFRWSAADAFVLVRSGLRAAVNVTLVAGAAQPTDATGDTTVTLRVNGVALEARTMGEGDQSLTWRVPAGAWVEGTNELWWRTSRVVRPADRGGTDTRVLALRVKAIAVARE